MPAAVEHPVTFQSELPSPQEYVQTTLNNNVFIASDDLSVPTYQNQPAPVSVIQQVPAANYLNQQVPVYVTTQSTALPTSYASQQPVIVQQSPSYQQPPAQFIIQSADAPVQHLQDVSNLPTYTQPTTTSQNVFLQRVPR